MTDAFAPASFPVIRTEAIELAEQEARAAGYEDGHARGYADGRALVDAQEQERLAAERERVAAAERAIEQRVATAVSAAAAAVAGLRVQILPVVEDAQRHILEATLSLAEAVVGAELSDAPVAAKAALTRALSVVDDGPIVSIRMNPDDVTVLSAHLAGEDLPVVADPSVARGDAVVDLDEGFVDARIATALVRAGAALREDER